LCAFSISERMVIAMRKTAVLVDTARCKGCYYCISACPVDAISLSGCTNAQGYETVIVDAGKCVGCGSCYRVCPDYVFELVETAR